MQADRETEMDNAAVPISDLLLYTTPLLFHFSRVIIPSYKQKASSPFPPKI